jgi:PKD repeat protein
MKTLKLLLTARQVMVLMLLTSLLTIVACSDDETPAPEPGVVDAAVPEFAVVNVPITLVDKSLSVASRAWTVTGGTLTSSSDKSVEATFTAVGAQTVSLEVTFENGTVVSESFDVTVAAELNGAIAEAGGDLTFAFGDSDISFTFDLSVADMVGDADSYAWTLPAGSTPESSTDASLTGAVIFGENPTVSVTLTRSADGASLTLTKTLETAGPANAWTTDLWGFERADIGGLFQTWIAPPGASWDASAWSIDDNSGYEGKGMTINYPGGDPAPGYFGIISRNSISENTVLTKGDIVLLSCYAKRNSGTLNGFVRIDNLIEGWMLTPETIDQAQGFQDWAYTGLEIVGDEWTRMSRIDTLDNAFYPTLNNVYPEVYFGGADPQSVSFDSFKLQVLGNTND